MKLAKCDSSLLGITRSTVKITYVENCGCICIQASSYMYLEATNNWSLGRFTAYTWGARDTVHE